MPVLTLVTRRHLAAELVRYGLHAIADTKHRQPLLKYVVRSKRGAGSVYARRPAGQNESLGVKGSDSLPGGIARENLTIHMALADSPGDEHAVLGTEIEDDDGLPAGDRSRLLGRRLLALNRAGDAEIRGYLDIIAG